MNVLTVLNSPVPVAYFQYLCGVRWRYSDPENPLYPLKQKRSSHDSSASTRAPNFVIRYPVLNILARAGSNLAGEPFYYFFFPACAWFLQINIARRTLLMLSTSMYFGQCLKDILKRPRPASPPVIRLEAMYETEYGMPSTHVTSAVTVSFSFLIFFSQMYQIPMMSGVKYACCWSGCVIVSRIYLGMHTLMEVTAGTVLSFALIYAHPYAIWFDDMQMKSDWLVNSCIGIGAYLLSLFIFSLDSDVNPETGRRRWNTARGDSTEILGWCAGIFIGSKYAVDLGILSQSLHAINGMQPFEEFSSTVAMWCVIRFVGGGLILLPVTLLGRRTLLNFFAYINGYSSSDLDKAKKAGEVELPYKFFSSFISACCSTLVVPRILQRFDLW